jgi:hypothetical protein
MRSSGVLAARMWNESKPMPRLGAVGAAHHVPGGVNSLTVRPQTGPRTRSDAEGDRPAWPACAGRARWRRGPAWRGWRSTTGQSATSQPSAGTSPASAGDVPLVLVRVARQALEIGSTLEAGAAQALPPTAAGEKPRPSQPADGPNQFVGLEHHLAKPASAWPPAGLQRAGQGDGVPCRSRRWPAQAARVLHAASRRAPVRTPPRPGRSW